ncbi:50S ribosomal protein L32e [Caldivirga maquilingensis]|uniref:Large ribosomal subunit protein eL32 n=1 Tax=Caldivirga maquilingensis (strain ATCC 700844 / DSM 13496 / JCM 10307 / IC-167) TaxID=397948 RepID=A8M9I5_CALMQ|nr:50S ribosomal protein L32e [Caldivirga maquilingensis]ABW00866.1 Ribosomal protein L32e [Caldivirga maquilingensis IC-167]
MSGEGQATEAKPEETQQVQEGAGGQQVEAKPSEAEAKVEERRPTLLDELIKVNSRKPNIPVDVVKLLKLSIRMRRERYGFIRYYNKEHKIRLEDSPWRRPKGIDNKIRMKRKGYPPMVNVGYRGPRGVRGIHPSGFIEVIVHNPEELSRVNPETQAIRIASTVGVRKRIEIIREAVRRGIKVLNVDKRTREAIREVT